MIVRDGTNPPSPRLLRAAFAGLPAVAGRQASEGWWALQDSNLRPTRCKRDALAAAPSAHPSVASGEYIKNRQDTRELAISLAWSVSGSLSSVGGSRGVVENGTMRKPGNEEEG